MFFCFFVFFEQTHISCPVPCWSRVRKHNFTRSDVDYLCDLFLFCHVFLRAMIPILRHYAISYRVQLWTWPGRFIGWLVEWKETRWKAVDLGWMPTFVDQLRHRFYACFAINDACTVPFIDSNRYLPMGSSERWQVDCGRSFLAICVKVDPRRNNAPRG